MENSQNQEIHDFHYQFPLIFSPIKIKYSVIWFITEVEREIGIILLVNTPLRRRRCLDSFEYLNNKWNEWNEITEYYTPSDLLSFMWKDVRE